MLFRSVTTIFVRQGHYALDAASVARYPRADMVFDRIGNLLDVTVDQIIAAGKG